MEQFLGAWCTITSLMFAWPQVWRSVRRDTTHGISPVSIVYGLTGSVLWFVYGVSMGRVPIWFSNASFIASQCIIIAVLLRHGRVRTPLLAGFGFGLAVLLAVLVPISATWVGATAIFVSSSSLVPQVLHIARTENLHGISISSWVITIVSAASWMSYGWILHDPIMSVINYITIPMMIYVVVRATSWRLDNDVPLFART